ncbi:MAG: hypothetical protein NT159_12845 [Proteobacteria bacterium]|nr:hypothetical protein [Pseudomonadota bacterium]
MSTIGSINSGSSNAVQTIQRTPELAELKGSRDKDGDSDDGGSTTVKTAPSASVNAGGEKIGMVINVAA